MELRFILVVFAFLYTSHLISQTTIGSNEAPVSGALLDLKQSPGAGSNSTKGFGLPRVKISKLGVLDIIPGLDLTDHIGLMVYNVNDCVNSGGDGKGLYVWGGTKWDNLSEPPLSSGVSIFKDPRDGEKYKYRTFKTADGSVDAGVWMLENMRATTYAQGGTAPTLKIANDDPTFKAKYYNYPMHEDPVNIGTDASYYNMQKELGLLYNFAAATNNENAVTTDQGQQPGAVGANEVENVGQAGDSSKKYIQGICPNGWHLPSDREWNVLDEVLAKSPELYSTNSGTTWNNGFASGTQGANDWATNSASTWRPVLPAANGHGATMKSPCLLSSNKAINADLHKSFPASKGGFAALHAGYGTVLVGTTNEPKMLHFGEQSLFWTSSSAAPYGVYHAAWTRGYRNDNPSQGRSPEYRFGSSSVRCKQN